MGDINKLVESRMAAMDAERSRLVESWDPYVKAVELFTKKQGKELTIMDKRNIARVLENALLESGIRNRSKLFETTDTSNISFLGIQLPVISALLPSLILNEIAVVQALDRRSGSVFFLDVKYGQAKGATAAAATMMGAKTGHNTSLAGRRYASQRVEAEVVGALGAQNYIHTATYFPLKPGYVTVKNSVETFTDDGNGRMISSLSGGSVGAVNYTTGYTTVTFNVQSVSAATTSYQYLYETATNEIPTVNISVTQETLTAEDFPLRANYTLAAAIDLEKAHGLNLEDEIVKYLGGEVKFTIDHLGIDLIDVSSADTTISATTPGTFTATPSTPESWVWRKFQTLDFIEKANVNIISKTLRAMCNFIIVGNDGARVIRQLDPHFKAAAGLETLAPTGPYKLGTLDGRLIIHDPLITASKMIFGYKGANYLEAGFIYAPYVPLFSTPTLITADLKAQKGFLSSAGFKVVNPGFFTQGTISIT